MLNVEAPSETITDCLQQDHRRLDKLLADLTAMIEDGELERSEYSLTDADAALRRHIRIEEELLFPLFDSRTNTPGPTHVMRMEHRQILGWLDELKESLAAGQRGPASTAMAELLLCLGSHNRKEERVLYPSADRLLSAEERRNLIARIRDR